MLATPISALPVTLRRPDPYRRALLFRFALVNMAATTLATAVWRQGWVDSVLDGDSSWLGLVIVVTFMVGLALAGRAAVELFRDLAAAHSAWPSPTTRAGRYLEGVTAARRGARPRLDGALKLMLVNRIGLVRIIAGNLVLLGLIGTVLGFIMALDGVDPGRAGDAAEVDRMVATLVDGMGMALNTTLIGAILNIWLIIDYRLLESGTVRPLAMLIERGAGHAGA